MSSVSDFRRFDICSLARFPHEPTSLGSGRIGARSRCVAKPGNEHSAANEVANLTCQLRHQTDALKWMRLAGVP